MIDPKLEIRKRFARAASTYDGYADAIELELGQAVTITHNRFGLDSGVTGMIVRIQIDWMTYKVKIGVLA